MSETVKEVWPEAHVVADKFYVIQLLTQSIFSQGSENKHKTIRHKRRLFMTIPEKLKNDKIEKRDILLASSTALHDLYQALKELREM